MQFRILGTLAVDTNEGALKIVGWRQQTVLAMLLLRANQPVQVEALTHALWGNAAPVTARNQVHICVSRLRQQLMAQGNGSSIATHAPGYVMYLSHETLDLLYFDRFTSSGRNLAAKGMRLEAAQCFRSAIGLWRGPVADGIDADAVRVAATRLQELRDAVLEDCLDLELAMGRHRQLIGELAALVAEYPLRESVRGKHMLALYRAGRTCDALQSYRAGRDILRDELGLKPSPELSGLERAILNQDPRLTWRPTS